jgi:hypothetical protein
MYLNIVFLPLLGSFLGGGFGRFLGPFGAGIITTVCTACSFFNFLLRFLRSWIFRVTLLYYTINLV